MSGSDTPAGAPLPLSELFQRVHLARATVPDPVESLRSVAARPLVVQDFRPLPESLEWELARSYWNRSGTDAFAQSEVPFLINNDGLASEDAAVTFFALCREATDLPAELAVRELGAGTGPFCRFFLDAFAAICRQEGADYYDRLRYVITDGSPRTVEQ
jgi:hypothetical protein